MLKSPICRIGGKGMISGWLRQYIPEHTVYCEPFCGGASLLFSKKPAKVEILNDCDNHLISFFNVLKHPEKRERLITELEYLPYSRKLWQEIREQWKQGLFPSGEVSRSAWWYYLNRSCFSGDQERGGFAVPSVTGRTPAQTFRNAINSLEAVASRLKGVTIECLDFKVCILRYDSKNTFFYIDCPYSGSEHYYGDSFTENDHYRLSEMLHGIKGRCMVSHYSSVVYDSLYADFNRCEYQSFKGSHKSAGGSKPRTTEVVYCNF